MPWSIFLFTLIGPAIGCLVFITADQTLSLYALTTSNFGQPNNIAELLITIPFIALYGLVFTYPIAGIPAAMAGLLFHSALRFITIKKCTLIYLTLGAACGLICTSPLLIVFLPSNNSLINTIPWIMAGILGGAVSGIVAGKCLITTQ